AGRCHAGRAALAKGAGADRPPGRRPSMLKEFKEFALKGNLIDLAIGFIIGAAFTGLVQSLVNDIIMPIIGGITPGGFDFSNLFVQFAGAPAATLAEARKAGA